MDFTKIPVVRREKSGTHLATRMRREGRVPIVLYGLAKPSLSLSVDGRDMDRFLRAGNRLVDLTMDGDHRTALLRAVQYDAITDELLHADFLRVDRDQEIEDTVPVVWKGRAKGTTEGGMFQSLRATLDILCRPADLPREITVEVDHLGVHDSIHAGDVKLPAGVKLRGSKDLVLCVVTTIKVEAAPEPVEGAASEPEVIGRKKEDAPAEGEAEAAKPGADKAEKKPDAKKK